MPYLLYVDDNFHYMDEDERSGPRTFATADEALSAARRIVDEWLGQAWTTGMTAEDLYDQYVRFGEDPFIKCVDAPDVTFSAWEYARQRCSEIASPIRST